MNNPQQRLSGSISSLHNWFSDISLKTGLPKSILLGFYFPSNVSMSNYPTEIVNYQNQKTRRVQGSTGCAEIRLVACAKNTTSLSYHKSDTQFYDEKFKTINKKNYLHIPQAESD